MLNTILFIQDDLSQPSVALGFDSSDSDSASERTIW